MVIFIGGEDDDQTIASEFEDDIEDQTEEHKEIEKSEELKKKTNAGIGISRHTVVCQRPRDTRLTCVIYRKRKVADFDPLYLLNYLEDFYIFYALHIHDLT